MLRSGALDELDVLVDDLVLDRGRRVDLGADDDVELFGERKALLDDLGPDRVRDEVARDDSDLRPDEPEAQALGESQVALELLHALLDRHVPTVRAAGVQPGVDPRAVVRGFEPVLLEQAEPVVDPFFGRVRVVRDVPLAEDLDAGGAEVGDPGHRGLEVEDGAVVGHEAVQAHAVCERGARRFGREGDVLGDGVGRGLVLLRDVRHAQPQLDRHFVHAVGETAGMRDRDDRRIFERPADAVALPQLCERVGLSLKRPQRHVGGDVDEVADLHRDAVDQGCRHPAVGRHPQPKLEAGDLAVLADVAESDGLDEVSLEEHEVTLLVKGDRAERDQTARRHAVFSRLDDLVRFRHKFA